VEAPAKLHHLTRHIPTIGGITENRLGELRHRLTRNTGEVSCSSDGGLKPDRVLPDDSTAHSLSCAGNPPKGELPFSYFSAIMMSV
jgi:hypothetical protein